MEPAQPERLTREEFSALVDRVRRDRHLSVRAAARLAGAHPATVQGWLNGKHLPTPALRPKFLRLVGALGLAELIPDDFWQERWTPSGGGRRDSWPGLAAAAVAQAEPADEE